MQPSAHFATHQAPEYPAGQQQSADRRDMTRVAREIELIANQPSRLRAALRGLDHDRLETRYRNWTVRQITHHLADSTMNFYCRWKLALTEERPTIKAYDETKWSALPDSMFGDVSLSTSLFDNTIARWMLVTKAMRDEQFDRVYIHPQYKRDFTLWQAVSLYAWHGDHHISQIEWLRTHYKWLTCPPEN